MEKRKENNQGKSLFYSISIDMSSNVCVCFESERLVVYAVMIKRYAEEGEEHLNYYYSIELDEQQVNELRKILFLTTASKAEILEYIQLLFAGEDAYYEFEKFIHRHCLSYNTDSGCFRTL